MGDAIVRLVFRVLLGPIAVAALAAASLLTGPQASAEALKPASPAAALKPEIMLQTGHPGHILAAAWTPDSRFVWTLSMDRQALILWEARTGRKVDEVALDIPAPAAFPFPPRLFASPDGRFAALEIHDPDLNLLVDLTKRTVGPLDGRVLGWPGDGRKYLRAPLCKTVCWLELADPLTGRATPLGPRYGNARTADTSADGLLLGALVPSGEKLTPRVWRMDSLAEVAAFPAVPNFGDYTRVSFDPFEGHGVKFADQTQMSVIGPGVKFDLTALHEPRSVAARTLRNLTAPPPNKPDRFRADNIYRDPILLSPDGNWFVANTIPDASWNRNSNPPLSFGASPLANPARRTSLSGKPRLGPTSVAADPGGARLAFLDDKTCQQSFCESPQGLRVLDVARGELTAIPGVVGDYDTVRWLSRGLLGLDGPTAWDTLLVDVDTRALRKLPIRLARPLGDSGLYVGARPGDSASADGRERYPGIKQKNVSGLVIYDDRTGAIVRDLERLPTDAEGLFQGDTPSWPDALAVSPDGAFVTAHYRSGGRGGAIRGRIGVWDIATGALKSELEGGAFAAAELQFSPDGMRILSSGSGPNLRGDPLNVWTAASGQMEPSRTPPTGEGWQRFAFDSDGGRVALIGRGEPALVVAETASGQVLAKLKLSGESPLRTAFMADAPVIWGLSDDGAVRFWSTVDWRELLTLYGFPDGGFLALTPEGRYDTNLPADTDAVFWRVRDQPRHLLSPQTFMRDYFEPGLARRTLQCLKDDNCATVFPPLRPLAQLNRVLPRTRILGVHPSGKPGVVRVDVEVEEGFDAKAANAKTHSGVFDLRLFRDGHLVGEYPQPAPAPAGGVRAEPLETWQARTRLGGKKGARVVQPFSVRLPARGDGPQIFTAYAFNADRVKGDTARLEYAGRGPQVRPPRAYVLAIGENRYDNPAWSLNYAVPDARLMATRLSGVPEHDTRVLTLISDGKTSAARKALIRDALSLLSGATPPAELRMARARLQSAGVAAPAVGGFEAAGPDDAVIISFSGHGWAGPEGDFYLLPSDAVAGPTGEAPRLDSLISAAELTGWLRSVDAGDMAIIIDACHSAASVQAAGFKAGPFGDAGLGQLAFDKGIRILAASQAADVAFEDARLGHGLLTQVLANEGLDAAGSGKADLDGDGRITLDEWLRFASRRLPRLSEELRGRGPSRNSDSAGFVFRNRNPAIHAKPQEPALFDFTGKSSSMVLRHVVSESHKREGVGSHPPGL